MMRRLMLAVAAISFGWVASSPAQTPSELLQKGIYTQNTVGDLDGALAIFRQILKAPQRRYAALAQAHIVQCLVQKGDRAAAARQFDVLKRDYANFKDIVAAVAAELRGHSPTRESIQLANTPTRITSAIRGRVTDDRGRPLRATQVRLSAAGGIEPRTVSTDDDGRFDVGDVRAGRYNVTVIHAGYLPLRYGQNRPRELGRLLDIADGQTLENVDFVLPRMSVISGRITDESKEPIADAIVLALRSVYFDGRRQFVPSGSGPVRSDDTGEFRLVGLTPGAYLVVARARDAWSVDEGGTEQMGYAPTYYPGTTNISSAREVAVALGQEAHDLEFALTPMRTATVSGTAVDSRGRPFTMVMVADEIRGDGFGMFGGGARGTVASDGRFSIRHVPAGHYKLEASTMTATGNPVDPPEIAILPIDVAGVDIEGVSLVGSTGGSLTGTIVTDSAAHPKPQDVRIRVLPRLMGQPEPLKLGTFGNRVGFAEVNEDATFAIDHVLGPSRIQVTVPDGWAVQAIRHHGDDVANSVLDLANGERWSDVQIVLTSRLTRVAGDVENGRNGPTSDGTVIVFSTDRDKLFEDSRYVRAVRPDQRGHYEITGLPPGDYWIAALDDLQQDAWWDPDVLNAVRSTAQSLSLGNAATATRNLTLVRR